MNKRFALEFLAALLLTAIVALFETVYFDGDGYIDDEIFLDSAFRHAAQTITVPDDHGANAPKAGKDQ
jgi:hypothetical protein